MTWVQARAWEGVSESSLEFVSQSLDASHGDPGPAWMAPVSQMWSPRPPGVMGHAEGSCVVGGRAQGSPTQAQGGRHSGLGPFSSLFFLTPESPLSPDPQSEGNRPWASLCWERTLGGHRGGQRVQALGAVLPEPRGVCEVGSPCLSRAVPRMQMEEDGRGSLKARSWGSGAPGGG